MRRLSLAASMITDKPEASSTVHAALAQSVAPETVIPESAFFSTGANQLYSRHSQSFYKSRRDMFRVSSEPYFSDYWRRSTGRGVSSKGCKCFTDVDFRNRERYEMKCKM